MGGLDEIRHFRCLGDSSVAEGVSLSFAPFSGWLQEEAPEAGTLTGMIMPAAFHGPEEI
jgi:hypothetical protein